MDSSDFSVGTVDEQRIVELTGLTITFRMGEKYCQAMADRHPADLGHPLVRLRQDPVGADSFQETVTGYGELRSEHPGRAGLGCGRHCSFEQPPAMSPGTGARKI